MMDCPGSVFVFVCLFVFVNNDQPVDCPGSVFVREPAARSVVPDSYQQFQLSFFSLADINNCSCSRRRPVSGIPAINFSLRSDKSEGQTGVTGI